MCSKNVRNLLESKLSGHFDQFSDPLTPQKHFLNHDRGTLKYTYSFKSLHRLVIPEKEFIFFEVKIEKK